MRKSEAGFTLIELLVVISILAVLFGLVALNLSSFVGAGKTESMNAEKDMVQTAVDVWMVQNPSSTLTANDVTAKQVGPASGDDFSPYLRRLSKYYYCWTTAGAVTSKDTAAACP